MAFPEAELKNPRAQSFLENTLYSIYLAVLSRRLECRQEDLPSQV